ncbi:MAG TPA: BTAD domain-containing putative transcriptional regulator [Candidatus Methylomirabilis sp.]|nr:BTAD domain-containing putative transcriptional regulator [Candidatus Methylomirabilis sp.]
MSSAKQAQNREENSRKGPRKVEAALARGECTSLDSWIIGADSDNNPAASDPTDSVHHMAACVFSALFFRQPDHPHLSSWAERARNSLETLPYPSRLTLARRLLRYYVFFGRPAHAMLLMDTLRAHGVVQRRSPDVQIQWGLLQALHFDAQGDHGNCLESVNKSQAIAAQLPAGQWTTTLYAMEISAYLGLGDIAAAHRAWDKSLAQLPLRGLLGVAHLHRLGSQIALSDGNAALALEHVEAALRAATQAGAPLFRALTCLAATELHHERGAPEAATVALRQAEQIADATGSAQLACLSAFMRAYGTTKSNARAASENDLRLGFGLAARHGYQNFCWWSPRLMTSLCVNALERGIETNYVQRLVQLRRLNPSTTPTHVEAWPWPVRIYTLGRFAVLINGQPARAGRKAQHKPLDLLKTLIAQGGRDISEDYLTATLWPDAEGDASRQAFDTTLHRLRKLLGNEQTVLLHGRKISLDSRYCWVDSWAFERLLSECETILAHPATDPDGEVLASLVDRVNALYHGPFLGKEFSAAWSVSLRERLRSRYLRHIISVGARWQQLGRWDRAIECYRKGLEIDDLAEQLYQNLMLCHDRLGQYSEALSVYRRCRFILSVVLGIAPSPSTENLHQRLRASA